MLKGNFSDWTNRNREVKASNVVPLVVRKKCFERIGKEDWKNIHKQFWNHDCTGRWRWIFSKRTEIPVKRRKLDTKALREHHFSYKYFLIDGKGMKEDVCQNFFLRMLGCKSHKILQIVSAKSKEGDLPSPDRRGKHTPPNKLEEKYLKDIDNHMMSFDPSISHYRRVHAPNRPYLPSELSINKMFKDYEAGGEIYRRAIKSEKHQLRQAWSWGMWDVSPIWKSFLWERRRSCWRYLRWIDFENWI